MHRSGILILTNHVSSLSHGEVVGNIVAGVKKIVSSTLYVHLANTSCKPVTESHKTFEQLSQLLKTETTPMSYQSHERRFASDVFPFLYKFYDEASRQCRHLDVNILLHSIGYHHNSPIDLCKEVNCIIADCTTKVLQNKEVNSVFQRFVQNMYAKDKNFSSLPIISILNSFNDSLAINRATDISLETVTSNGSIVIGGTYDSIHSGHKVLLSESILLSHKRLLIGLTDGEMLDRKTLSDLIKPWEVRRQDLVDFICDIAHFQPKGESEVDGASDQKAILQIDRITDPIGPSGTDKDLQCIVVSKETEKGGQLVNQVRLKNGLNELKVHVIGKGSLVDDQHGSTSPTSETKSSSSTLRYESLSLLRKSPNKSQSANFRGAYVIGLTGGIASGKSSVCSHMRNLGAVIIDCDKLGHMAYEPETATFKKVVNRFGKDIISSTGTIDRKILASKVFTSDSQGNRSNLADLNAIVWPEVERLARAEITEAINSLKGEKVVCVLDAAVLLEAGWEKLVNEVWVCVIPKQEAIKRIEERDGWSKEEAEKRIGAQMSGRERVARSHVALCTLWEVAVTKSQVAKAWSLLQERISL